MRKKNVITVPKKAIEKINSSDNLSQSEKKAFLRHILYLSKKEQEYLYSII